MRPFRSSRLFSAVAMIGLLLAIFLAGNLTGYLARPAIAAESPAEFALFWEAWDLVLTHFVDRDDVDLQTMTYGAIVGMLSTLGDANHTAFFEPEEAALQQSSLEGSFEGIGAYVDTVDGLYTVISPIRGSPAERAGLLAGDVVLTVNGEEISGQPAGQVIAKMRGPSGTAVTLTVHRRHLPEPVEINIVRGWVDIQSVLWAPIPDSDLVYLRITQFTAETGRDMAASLEAIHQHDGEEQVAGMILDLRNNPGGYFTEALHVGSHFLDEGAPIVHERDADDKVVTHYAQGSGLAREMPIFVLINEGTASAAEILASALQENGRAKIVGERSLGTGTVLRPFTLSNGSVLRLGVSNWLTPDGNLIKEEGVVPDVLIEQEQSIPMIDDIFLEKTTRQALYAHEDRQFTSALILLRLSAMRGMGGGD